jgi:hypothetical protein
MTSHTGLFDCVATVSAEVGPAGYGGVPIAQEARGRAEDRGQAPGSNRQDQ